MGYNFHYCHLSSSEFKFYLLSLLFKKFQWDCKSGPWSLLLIFSFMIKFIYSSWLDSNSRIEWIHGSVDQKKVKISLQSLNYVKNNFYVSFLNTIYANVGSFICGPLSSFSWYMSEMQGFQFYSLLFFFARKS